MFTTNYYVYYLLVKKLMNYDVNFRKYMNNWKEKVFLGIEVLL